MTAESWTVTGPKCRGCDRTEQRCAYLDGHCCASCSHWDAFTDSGDLKVFEPPKHRYMPSHGWANPTGSICGTEVGYARHRQFGAMPCVACRYAHRQAKVQHFLSPRSSTEGTR